MGKSLIALALVAAVIASGCTQAPAGTDTQDAGDNQAQYTGNPEDDAYAAVESELEKAIEDIDLEELENELLV